MFVGNLSYRVTEQQLTETFSEVGPVRSVFIGTDRETGRPRGFAFVEFDTSEAAANAVRRFDGQEIDGRKVRVNPAEERAARGGFRRTPSEAAWTPPAPATDGFGGSGRGWKNKGSRRNLRARKRSLNF